MNLVADEGVDRAVVERLRADGHDIFYVAELSPGIADEEVLRQANARSALLITLRTETSAILCSGSGWCTLDAPASPFGLVELSKGGARGLGIPRARSGGFWSV